jgi:hypothetical protein
MAISSKYHDYDDDDMNINTQCVYKLLQVQSISSSQTTKKKNINNELNKQTNQPNSNNNNNNQ